MDAENKKFIMPTVPQPQLKTIDLSQARTLTRNALPSKLMLGALGMAAIKAKVYGQQSEKYRFDKSELASTSFLGLPVINWLEFDPANYTRSNGKGVRVRDVSRGQDAFRIDTVLIEVTQERNIVETAVPGRPGTVDEYIADGDHNITIRGALVAPENGQYPTQEVDMLRQICEAIEPIAVTSSFLQIFEIYEIVIRSVSFPQVEGFNNVQPFSINAKSTRPFIIKAKNP